MCTWCAVRSGNESSAIRHQSASDGSAITAGNKRYIHIYMSFCMHMLKYAC